MAVRRSAILRVLVHILLRKPGLCISRKSCCTGQDWVLQPVTVELDTLNISRLNVGFCLHQSGLIHSFLFIISATDQGLELTQPGKLDNPSSFSYLENIPPFLTGFFFISCRTLPKNL